MIGSALGHYEVTGRLGEGGMGEVYQATDSKLGRSVAIKILPEAFARDSDRVARFEREARLLASLNHPHIAVIHGLEESDGRAFLVMELVEGETLADAIASHPSGLPLPDVLNIAGQIIDALIAAHEKGVIHRDLKPSNIKVMSDSRVKLLDFGLAKAMEEAGGSSGPAGAGGVARAGGVAGISQSPTLTSPAMTQAGLILGTAAYMSPEQAKGAIVDRRTDIFSFGCVLYEMLTGRQAFNGDTVAETLARVIEREPDLARLPAPTPPSLRRLLRRCLVKDRSQRLQHIGDARLEIEEARAEPRTESPSSIAAGATTRERGAWIVAGMLALALAVAVSVSNLRTRPAPAETRVDLIIPASADPFSFALSPDRRMLAFVAAPDGLQRLWIRRLDRSTSTPMAGTEGALYPFWSPDSRSIGFFAGGELKRIDIDDGVARTLTPAIPGNGGSWGTDGQILFAPTPGSGLFQIAASSSGGEVKAVTRAEGTSGFGHRFPQLLPDGRRFLFYVFGAPADRGIYLASLDEPETARRVTAADGAGLYVEPGWLLFPRQGTLLARRFDPASAELFGDPIVIAEGVSTNGASARAFSAASTGIIAHAAGGTQSRLTWFDRSGAPLGMVGGEHDTDLLDPAISPDGTRVAVSRVDRNNADIWVYDDKGGSRQLTLDPGNDLYPVWSPDGSQLLFQSDRRGTLDLYVASATTPGRERAIKESPERKFPSDWSSDGRAMLYFQVSQRDGLRAAIDLRVQQFDADPTGRRWLDPQGNSLWALFSPRADFVAYYSDEVGSAQQVYVRRFTTPEDRWTISTGGGVYARWSRNGRELYYIDPGGRLMAVPVEIKGMELVPGTPKELFRPRIVGLGLNRVGRRHQYDVHPDGRFLINVETERSRSIALVLNWNPAR